MFNSLKSKVLISFFILIILPVIAGGYLLLNNLKENQLKHIDILQNHSIKRISGEFKSYVKYNVFQLNQMTELNLLDISDPKKLNEQISANLLYNNNIDQFIVLNKNGRELAHAHRYKIEDNHKYKTLVSSIEFQFPLMNNTPYYGDVKFQENTGEPVMNISFCIKQAGTGQLIGVAIATLRLKPIWNLLASTETMRGQTLYILDSSNRLTAHPNPSYVLKNIIFEVPNNKIAEGLSGVNSYINRTNINFGNQFFTIVSEYEIEEAFRSLISISKAIFAVTSIVFVLSVMLIFYNMKFIVNPLKQLASVAKEIEGGNLEKTVDIRTNDELGEMAEAFNKMTKKLRENTNQLKDFNIGLQKKINKEIEKTRQMEQVVFEQKKFADMGQMINAIAHQWRQPLNNIGLIQQHLTEGFLKANMTTSEYREYSGHLMDIVQGMSITIDDFRTFFTCVKTKEKFNVICAVKDFMKLTTAQLNSNNISFKIYCRGCNEIRVFGADNINEECEDKNFFAIGYPGEFKQVLQNIVANSKDAFHEREIKEPCIEIIVERNQSSLSIRFIDNAGGIPEDILPNIFDLYFTTKAEGKGTGIGLYISKLIIDDHFGGRLYARNLKTGVEFIIEIPASSDAD